MTTWIRDGVTEGGTQEGGRVGGKGGREGERENRKGWSEGRKEEKEASRDSREEGRKGDMELVSIRKGKERLLSFDCISPSICSPGSSNEIGPWSKLTVCQRATQTWLEVRFCVSAAELWTWPASRPSLCWLRPGTKRGQSCTLSCHSFLLHANSK